MQRIGLQDVHDRRNTREAEERVAAFLLVKPVLCAARVRRAEREIPIRPNPLIDVDAERVAREAIEEANRAFLTPVGCAREDSRLAPEPPAHADAVLQQRLGVAELVCGLLRGARAPV